MAVNLLTVSAYARYRGCDEKAVRKAIAENRISAQEGDGGRKLIDPEVADIQWARNTRARVASGDGPRVPGGIGDSAFPAAGRDAANPGTASQPSPAGYTAARARTELANAGLAEMQLAKLRAEVCDVGDINRASFDVARELRDAMDSAVNTLASELAPLDSADACALVLRRHNRTIQEMLAKGLREKLGVRAAASLPLPG